MLRKRREFHKDIDDLITQSAEAISQGLIKDGYEYLDKALGLDFDHPRVLTGLKYINFWQDRIRSTNQYAEPVDQGESLLQHWKDFMRFANSFTTDEQLIQSFRKLVFSRVFSIFSSFSPQEIQGDSDIQLWLGISCKGMGNYDESLEYLLKALQAGPPRGRLLAELADVYALIGEDQRARVMLREAFFVDPQDIDIEAFEAELFLRLIQEVSRTGLQGDELREWIPVYGTLWGILNVKRELRALEYGKLRQKIFSLEQEIREDSKRAIITPRVLNHYFWLIDHMVMSKEDQHKIDEILLKIRSISAEVYRLYTN